MLQKTPVFCWDSLSVGKQHLLILVLPLLFAIQTQAKLCTSLRAIRKEVNPYGQPLCVETYRAKCGWFTFKECTFYEKVPCKSKNVTAVTYKIVTDCCPGYKRDEDNLTCIKDPDSINMGQNQDEDDNGISMSHGAFAAIGCGGLFIVCVTIVIVIHVRKKQLRDEKKAKQTNSAEREKMLHI